MLGFICFYLLLSGIFSGYVWLDYVISTDGTLDLKQLVLHGLLFGFINVVLLLLVFGAFIF